MKRMQADLDVRHFATWPQVSDARRNVLLGAATLLLLGLLFLTDRTTQYWILNLHHPWLDAVFHVTKIFGRTIFALALGALSYVGGILRRNPKWQRTGRLIAFSVLLGGAIVLVAKPLFGRMEDDQVHANRALSHRSDAQPALERSLEARWGRFPSGDSTVAFATASALALEFPAGAVVFFVLASLTAVGRVYNDVHFVSDVFAGGVLGWMMVSWLSRLDDPVQ